MEAEYYARHIREILGPCRVLGEWVADDCNVKILEPRGTPGQSGVPAKFTPLVVLGDRGVWPAFEVDILMQAETEGLRWRPARELQGLPGAPETSDTPMLPIPFTARELAAFMLAGTGALVASFYGDWSNGPDLERLGEIDRDSFARRAVIDAFAAYRLAKEEVGEWESVWSQRETARKASSREPNNTALLKAFDEAQATWDTAHQTWLNAMVIELLGVGVEIESYGPATGNRAVPMVEVPSADTQTGQDAPVVDVPAPATETKTQRQDRRLKACEDDRLVMHQSYRSRLPDGVGVVANREGVTRQTFSTDIKAALKRREDVTKPSRVVHLT